MARHLILRLEAPLMAFGAEMVDMHGPTLDHPVASMVTGLLANALGWRREERAAHQRLQDRLVLGARLDRPGQPVRDYQTARLGKRDWGWTTSGRSESTGRGNTFTHIRVRHYLADAALTLAIRLDPADEAPDLDALAAALTHPARPLFLGRKPCLPSGPLLHEPAVEAPTVVDALAAVPLMVSEPDRSEAKAWGDPAPPQSAPSIIAGEAEAAAARVAHRLLGTTDRTTRRDWRSGVHTGLETLVTLCVPTEAFATPTSGRGTP